MNQAIIDRAVAYTCELLAVPSPTGFTDAASTYLMAKLTALGFTPQRARKGTVVCAIGGSGRHAVLAAHVDTLGLIVREVQANGRLRFSKLGGPSFQALETEQVTVHTRDGKQYTGVVQVQNASKHVNMNLETVARDQDTMEVLLDALVSNQDDVAALGIGVGDIICLDPRTVVTPSGFIRSRFLDDKLSAGMLLALAEAAAQGALKLARKTTLFFSVYEEVGHGAAHGTPADAEDFLVVDMGCVGEGLTCTETQVSICAKDSTGPFDYALTSELIALAKEHQLQYAVDVYPAYGSDAGPARAAGNDLRYGLIGAGVYASHGYERAHVQGVEQTLRLLEAYLTK